MPKDKQHNDIYLAFPDDNAETESKMDNKEADPNIRPWVRFGARNVDYIIAIFVFSLALSIFAPSFNEEINNMVFGLISLFVWIFVESILLITWGSTPGKWLLNIQIKTNKNKKPSLFNAFKRSIKVWFFGLAIGFPFISIFTLISAHSELTKNKTTTWDKSEHFTITHKKIGIYRATIALFLLVIYPILVILAQFYNWF